MTLHDNRSVARPAGPGSLTVNNECAGRASILVRPIRASMDTYRLEATDALRACLGPRAA